MRRSLLLLLFLSIGLLLYAQEPVRFGDREVYLEANVHAKVRGHKTSSLELGIPAGEKLNVLVQFGTEKIAYDALKQKGVELGDYLGSNAYYAQVAPGSRPSDFVGTGLRTVVPIRSEWKAVAGVFSHAIPEWVHCARKLKMTLSWFTDISWEQIKDLLVTKNIRYTAFSERLRIVEIVASESELLALAANNAVASLRWCDPPQQLNNRDGARLCGAGQLQLPTVYKGKGLTGKGVRIGLWDSNVGEHVDYGARIQRLEYEISIASTGAHGMHTAGTILGSGLLDERARGIAPEARIWASNFNEESNGKIPEQEMLDLYDAEHISLTSNSYGMQMFQLCGLDNFYNYTAMGFRNIDILSCWEPTLTHVFSAGNDQGACNKPFGHSTRYSKNIISVAAVDKWGAITDFSSFGPLRDGRMYPIISARGKEVYSTIDGERYAEMNGTSMACPMVTGHLALLTQRWRQLHGGTTPYNYFLKALVANTARDAGNVGPDYKYGFGILDAEAALMAMEEGWFHLGTLSQGGADQKITLDVPAGVKELRVMLCWNDPVSLKEYKTGETPLVNDLDLTVANAGGTIYWPYTLNHEKPNEIAVATKKNLVDNIEQVAVKNPTVGSYTITVSGTINQEDKQSYAVVWYYDQERPSVASPLVGDVYSPGETIYLRAEGLGENLQVEFSADGGQNFQVLGNYAACSEVQIPFDVLPTSKALLRLTGAQNRVFVMPGCFTIMPQVQGLQLEAGNCSSSGWKLKWMPVVGATKYKILRGNVQNEGYDVIDEVNAPSTEYLLAEKYTDAKHNFYSVQAINADGIEGRRSVAAYARVQKAVKLVNSDLPLRETFIGWTPLQSNITTGKNLRLMVRDAVPALKLPIGSQMLEWQAIRKATNWNKPFESRDNVAAIDICALDLTGIAQGTELHFVIYEYMTMTPNKPKGSMFRLLINGDEEATLLGQEQIVGDEDEHRLAWDFSKYVGRKLSLRLETALQDQGNNIVIVYYQLVEKKAKTDVGVIWSNYPPIKAKANMATENVNFKIRNNGSQILHNVPVSITVDENVIYSDVIETLQPFEDKLIEHTYDFTSTDAHKYQVTVRTDVANDQDAENNTELFEVYNLGDAIAMPECSYLRAMGGLFPQVPYETVTVHTPKAFVDARGALANYMSDDQAVLQICPSNEKNRVQVTFSEYDFAVGDTLYVYKRDVPADLKVASKDASVVLTGTSKEGQIYLAEGNSGALTFYFRSHNEQPATGWKAEVRELEQENQWTLLSFSEQAGSDATHRKLVAQVKNNVAGILYDVPIEISYGGKEKRYVIPQLKAASETLYEIPEELEVVAPTKLHLVATLGKDADVSDNKAELQILVDPLWHEGGIKKEKALYIAAVTNLGNEQIDIEPSHSVVYMPDKEIVLYKGSKNALQVRLSGQPSSTQLPAQVRLWVDFDDDNILQDLPPELVKTELVAGTESYWLTLDLSTQAALTSGKHRMRIMLANEENYLQFKDGKTIPWGSVVDFTANVKEGKSPYDVEVALLAIEGVATAHDLSATTPVRVKVRNNGLTALHEVKLSYSFNNASEVVETLTCNIAPHGGEEVLTFMTTADLSHAGKYTLKVEALVSDANPKDNVLTHNFYSLPPQTDKLYALKYVGDKVEDLRLPSVGATVTNQATIEGWWRLDKAQTCDLVYAYKVGLQTLAGHKDYPDNTLVFLCGAAGSFVSETPVIVPGKWQHIAVSMYQMGKKPKAIPEVYLDGEKVRMKKVYDGDFAFKSMWLNVGLQGQHAMFRLWNTVRTQRQIKNFMTQSVRDKTTKKLPKGCIGEYIFTEGKSIVSATDDVRYAFINTSRADVWQPIKTLVQGVTAEGENIPANFSSTDEITVTMPPHFNNYTNVKLSFDVAWAQTELTLKGNTIASGQVFDFSVDPEHKLPFKAELIDLFGTRITQDFTVRVVSDLASACDLVKLTIPKDANPGLKQTIELNNLPQEVVLNVENESEQKVLDITKVTCVVNQISPSAKLYNGAQELVVGTNFDVDFRSPLYLRVEAANGRDAKLYILRLGMQQEIEWQSGKLKYTYERLPKILDARATSGLPVKYFTQDPAVATVNAKGELVAVGVGTTQIFAVQEGNSQYAPAVQRVREIEILRAPLTIKVQDVTVAQGDKLPRFTFTYEGLQYEGTEQQFDAPYEIRTPDNKIWNATMPALPVGEYTIAPKGYTEPYPIGNYLITRTEGKLKVNAAQTAQKVTLKVVDDAGAALPSVAVQCGKINATTDANGGIVLYLLPGDYEIAASKDGYLSKNQHIVVTDKAVVVTLLLKRLQYELLYHVDAHGILQGNTRQWVAEGEDSETVVAMPNSPRYRFKRWSDNEKNATRVDKNVRQRIEVTAEFEEIKYTLNYIVGVGGEFVSGVLSQEVLAGENGTQVSVKAKAGYLFIGWSDGKKDMIRTDLNVFNDVSVTALFIKPYLLSWSESFELGASNLNDWEFAKPSRGKGWQLLNKNAIPNVSVSDGNVLLIDPTNEGYPIYVDCYAATPWLSLSDRDPNASVVISYNRYYTMAGRIAKLEYCFEDGEWKEGKDVGESSFGMPESYTLTKVKIGTNKFVRFRWNFSNDYLSNTWLAIDNIKVKYDPTVSQVTLRYMADENGMIQESGKEDKFSVLELRTTAGVKAAKVKAVPNEGYLFEKWSDGNTAPEREDDAELTVKAIFKEIPKLKFVVRYEAGAHGKIVGVAYQRLFSGETTTYVKAEPEVGYKFVNWSDNSTQNPRADIVTTNDAVFTAQFEKITPKYILTYIAGDGGTIRGEATQTVEAESSGSEVEAVPDNGYRFVKWDDGITTAKRTETNVQATKTYKAEFIRTFTLKYIAGEHGTIEGDATQIVDAGGSGTEVEAKADDGYRFVKWSDDVATTKRTDKNVIADKTVTAEFETIPMFTLTYTAGDGGTIRGEATQTVTEGGDGTEVEAVANDGYRFVKWDDGITTARRTETNVQASKVYTAQFAADVKTFAVTLAQGAHGTISIKDYTAEQLQAVAKDTELTVVVTPDAGWKLKTLTANGADIADTKTFTVIADVEVKVEFEEEGGAPQPTTFAVTVKKEGEGELKVTGIEESKLNAVPEGTELTAVATPAKGWKLKSLTAGTQDISADGKFTVTANVEVKAVFEKEGTPQPKTYVVTLTKEGEGELKVTGIEEERLKAVPAGTELTAVATPKTGWKLKSLTAGSQDISADGKFTVTADVEVKAVFERTTSVDDTVLANVLVAPNPFTTQLRLVCNGATGRYDLLNAQGVVVRSGNMADSEVAIETSDLTSGLYLLRLTAENGTTKTITVVKE